MTEPVPLWKVKEMLTEVSSERPLGREATSALQHAEAGQKIEGEDSRKLFSYLRTLPYVSETLAIKIADILPEVPDEVRLLLPKDNLPLDEIQVKEILDAVAKHR